MRRLFAAWADVVRRRPGRLTAAVVVVTIALAGGLSRLAFDSSQATMISPASQVYLDNLKYQRSFGGELMVVVFDGDIRALFTPANRAALAAIERDVMRSGRFHSIIGPDTAMTFADRQVDVAAGLVMAAGDPAVLAARAASADARRLAAAGERSLANPRYVDFLLFDEHGDVRAAQRGAFPDASHALLVAHLRGNLALDAQGRAVRDITRAVRAHPLAGFTTFVTGTAALTSEVSDKTKSEMGRSGLLSLAAMVLVLLLVFRARWRLLVLPVIGVAMAWAFGAFGYLGIPLTMVTMSGLPILVGLGVDFAIQVHARYEEEAARPAGATDGDPLTAALAGIGPALVVALVAATAGFLALRISPVPMVDDFAVMLAVGTAVLLVAVVVFVPLALVWRDRVHGARAPTAAAPARGVVERVVAALTSPTRVRPAVVVGVALVVAVTGLAVNSRIPVQTDPEKLVAAGSPVLRDLARLRQVAGSSGDAGFMVEADDVMRPDVLAWMADFERRELARRPTELVSANSIASITAQVTGSTPTPGDVRAVMAAAPPGIRDTFLDTRTGRAQVLFAAGHLSLEQLDVLYRGMAADARATAPAGVRVVPSGLALIGIETVRTYTQGRGPMTLVALAAVFLWLLVSLRSLRTALLALLPVVTAVGAASLAVQLAGLRVSLLAALSSPLVIAVCTEFSVLIIERAREEERRGVTPAQAVTNAASSIGRALAVSGLTITAAFAVVGMSGFPLLASFGTIVAVDVAVAMVCALVILPPVLRGAGGRVPSGVLRRVALDDGRELVVRHATAADAAGLGAFYAALPSGDRYRRFFGGGAPPATWLDRWVREGERGGAVLLAVADGAIVGEAGYGPPDDGAGDFGISVAREWRGWLGPYLLDALVDVARGRGVAALRADVLAENRPMLRLLASRGDAWLPQDDLRTVRVVIPTSGRAPAWPPGFAHPRVAVEVAGGRWRAASAAIAAGAQVIACPRHGDHCPLFDDGGEGGCPLVDGADVIVLVEGGDAAADAALLNAHAGHGDRPVVVDDGHTPVDDLVARVVDAAER